MNEDLRLSDAEAKQVSPLFWNIPPGRMLDAVVGGAESGQFRWQSRVVADGWCKSKAETRYEEIAGANHFTVIGPLSDPSSAMVTRLVELAKQTAALKL